LRTLDFDPETGEPICDDCNINMKHVSLGATKFMYYDTYKCPKCKKEIKYNASLTIKSE
jgi:tRNA(Ile2) C34 agmatinyltransferase TiaS